MTGGAVPAALTLAEAMTALLKPRAGMVLHGQILLLFTEVLEELIFIAADTSGPAPHTAGFLLASQVADRDEGNPYWLASRGNAVPASFGNADATCRTARPDPNALVENTFANFLDDLSAAARADGTAASSVLCDRSNRAIRRQNWPNSLV